MKVICGTWHIGTHFCYYKSRILEDFFYFILHKTYLVNSINNEAIISYFNWIVMSEFLYKCFFLFF